MIVGGPRNAGVPIGRSATFSCNISAEPTPTVRWEFNGAVIDSGSKYTVTTTPGVTVTIQSVLRVNNLTLNDAGVYTCFVENIHGNETSSANLLVQCK